MLGKILAFLVSTPQFLGFLKDVIQTIISLFKKNKDQQFIADLRKEIKALKQAKNKDERIQSADRINDIIKRL